MCFGIVVIPLEKFFIMETKLQPDWENIVYNMIEDHKGDDGFPLPEDYGTTEADVKDYIYDKQRILDRMEERSKNLLVPGILLVMPVIILSGFGDGLKILLSGVFAGVLLTMLYFVVAKAVDKRKLKNMRDETIEKYISKLMDAYA